MNDCFVLESPRIVKKAWNFDVDVVAEPPKPKHPPDEINFRLASKLMGPGGELIFNKGTDKMPSLDYYLITFTLKDETKLGLQFAPNPMVAFWVNWNSKVCPQGACFSREIYAVSVDTAKGEKLVVRNEDSTVADFAFSLGFLKGGFDPSDPNGYIRFDPIGSNQNGGFR